MRRSIICMRHICTLDMWKSSKSMLFCIFDAIFARIYFNSEKITVVVTCMVGVRKTVKKNRQCLINSEACINIKRIRLVLVVYLVFSCYFALRQVNHIHYRFQCCLLFKAIIFEYSKKNGNIRTLIAHQNESTQQNSTQSITLSKLLRCSIYF